MIYNNENNHKFYLVLKYVILNLQLCNNNNNNNKQADHADRQYPLASPPLPVCLTFCVMPICSLLPMSIDILKIIC